MLVVSTNCWVFTTDDSKWQWNAICAMSPYLLKIT